MDGDWGSEGSAGEGEGKGKWWMARLSRAGSKTGGEGNS